jgi:glycosyltransferase involved in cell wall biosynthesis
LTPHLMDSLVSISLLTFNRAAALRQSIEDLLLQDYPNFELIINDDHSSDGTEDLCREIAKSDARVRYYRNTVNLGYAGNQNAAIGRARGDFVAIVHDGDRYQPNMISTWANLLTAHPHAALAFCALDALDQNGNLMCTHKHDYSDTINGLALLEEMLKRRGSPIYGIVMVRKACIMNVGPFDPRFRTLADVDMWMRLLSHYDACYTPRPLVSIAPREANHHNNAANWRVQWEYERIYEDNTLRAFARSDKYHEINMRQRLIFRAMRLRAIIWCIRTGRVLGALKGIKYILFKAPILR